jgi:hypothetical protein
MSCRGVILKKQQPAPDRPPVQCASLYESAQKELPRRRCHPAGGSCRSDTKLTRSGPTDMLRSKAMTT